MTIGPLRPHAVPPPPYWCHLCDRTVRSPTDAAHDFELHLTRVTKDDDWVDDSTLSTEETLARFRDLDPEHEPSPESET